jgi:hypothetical protein
MSGFGERQRMDQTARLVARAELAAIDPGVSTDDLVRITNLARRAEASLFVLIGSPQRRPPADRVPAFNALDWLEAKERSAS